MLPRSLVVSLFGLVPLLTAADWPQFRGPDQAGVAEKSQPPLVFNEKEKQNVAWKAPLSGRGVSSPIVVGGKVIVTASSWPKQDRLKVIAFSAADGRELWKREFWATGWTFTHPTSANAAPTPASDGKRIFAFFSSNDLACLDLDGNLLWYRGLSADYPDTRNDVGMSSSPVVVDDTVVVQMENQADSWAAGINAETGEDRWRVDRNRENSWSTPAVYRGAGGKPVVLLTSIKDLTALEAKTGRELWKHSAPTGGIASTTVAGDVIFLPANGLTKLRLDASANGPVVAWDSSRISPGSPSPIIAKDRIYTINRAGVLTCANAENGEQVWQTRLKGNFWATPFVTAEHLFAVNQDGQLQVVKLGEKGEVVATSEFGEQVLGSPAVVDNAIYVRSDKHLWKIAAP